MKQKLLQRRLRFITLALAALGGAYLWSRYEVIHLPVEGCSPIHQVRAGASLWVDLSPARIEVGDALFFQVPSGQLAFSQVERIKEGPRSYWVRNDNEACPGSDSESLGWVSANQVHGRLIMALDM